MRRLAVISGFCAVALAAVVLSAPWWLGMAVSWFGPSFGLTFGSYERVGYSRFVLRAVEYRRDPVVVKVQQAEADTPFVWLWRRYMSAPGPVVATEWSTEVSGSKSKEPTKSEWGWLRLQRLLDKLTAHLAVWVPTLEAGRGVVTWPGAKLTFTSAALKGRVVSTPDLGFRSWHGAVSASFSDKESIEVKVALIDGSGNAMLRSNAATLTGSGTWWDQPLEFAAHFEERGWLPPEATLRANKWEIAGERVKLGGSYATIRGTGLVEWKDGQLSTEISADGQPLEKSAAPPLTVNLRGHLTNEAFVAESLDVNLPGITSHLSAPVAIDREGKLHSEPSTFSVDADLAKQPWFKARGALRGEGQISAGEDRRLVIKFSASGDAVAVADTALSHVKANGVLEWPVLTIESGTITTPDGSELACHGGWNILSREIVDASLRGRVGRALFARWLPEYPKFDAVQIEAKGSGPWATAKHEGHAEVANFSFARTHPLNVKVTWNGEGAVIKKFAGEAQAGDTKLVAEGSADRTRLNVTSLTFANGDVMRLQLAKPAELKWGAHWQLSEVDLTGPEASVHAAMVSGEAGNAQIRAQHFSSEWLRSVLIFPPTKWGVDSLNVEGNWSGGPAAFSVNAALTVHLGDNRAAQLSTQLKGSGEGVEIASLRVAEGGAVIVNATGRLPILIRPAAVQKWELAEDAPFTLDAATSPNPSFWEKITQLAGVEVVQPEATVHFEGSLNKPRGEARISAVRVAPVEGRFKVYWPKVETLNLHLVGDKEGLTLEHFSVAVEGQEVRASGRLPVAVNTWLAAMKQPREFAQRGEVRIEVPDAEIAAFVHYFPEYIAPKGRFHLDLTFQGEQSVTGFIRMENGTSRPLGPLGVLQEISADIRFSGRTANLQAVTARMGGQLVTLQGSAQLPVGRPPQLNLTLTGENLPFVRRAGLLVRGDLDLKLVTPQAAPPSISGVVRLRDSLFLADIRSMIPSGAKGVAGRPPYFALETPPLNAWGLDIKIEGEKFLRLRTPVFNGTATARFKLDGTLGEPRISGEAIVDQGYIRLPFANFEVNQGEVRLSAGQLEPQIWLAATTRRYGYDLRLELSGEASSPNLIFSSSPPLEAEQVLLMVMAGEAPRNEVSTTDRQRVARFGAFFGQSLLGSFGGDSTGADRLTISSGSDISAQGRETYSIEYRLADRWAVTGEYDEFDDYYGGLKWRFYPKGDKKRDEKK